MLISEAYNLAVQQFVQARGDDYATARSTARLLVDHVAGVRYAHLMKPDAALDDGQALALETSLQRVVNGYPVPYILGHVEFFKLDFYCDERALIPRPETELLVDTAVARVRDTRAPLVADMGTGTGCIAISVARELPAARIVATDASAAALDLARVNAARLRVADRIELVAGTLGNWAEPLLASTKHDGRGFDVILSNPPYISVADIEELQPEVRDWEPRLALAAGDDGLACYREIAAQCAVLLTKGGALMVELGAGQFNQVGAIFRHEGWSVEPGRLDFAGIERVLVAGRP